MSQAETRPPPRRARLSAGAVAILLTASACALAIAFRTPLRSRYWAWQITQTSAPAERAMYVTLLCNAGNGARWGISALLQHRDAEIRQFGTVVLHHVRAAWARDRLLQLLADPNDTVRELAAVGLAIHRDDTVIPALEQMYLSAAQSTATTACIALARLATPKAIAALSRLVPEPADVERRAALVDALSEIGEPACVPPLLILLDDHRPCSVPTHTSKLARDALHAAQIEASLPTAAIPVTSQSSGENVPATIAERAAASLARITGVDPPFSSDLAEDERQDAKRRWTDWYASTTITTSYLSSEQRP